jgi:hypothetical protein
MRNLDTDTIHAFYRSDEETERRAQILEDFDPLFERSEREGLWFWTRYQDLWFSPDTLRAYHQRGSFIWEVADWSLRDPKEHIEELSRKVAQAETELARVIEQTSFDG